MYVIVIYIKVQFNTSRHFWSSNGFTQDQIIASHPCFGGPMDVNCYCLLSQFTHFLMCLMILKGLQTHMWHHLHSLSRHNWQYVCFFTPLLLPIFLPVHNSFYPSKWRVDGSLHKAMTSNSMDYMQLSSKESRLQVSWLWSAHLEKKRALVAIWKIHEQLIYDLVVIMRYCHCKAMQC